MICDSVNSSNLEMLFGICSFLWSTVSVIWIINNKYINYRHTKPIHFILSFVLVFKSAECIFLFLSNRYCDIEIERYFELGYGSSYTLFNTFLYTILLLMSKGLSLTREYLNRNEISLIALIMGVIYLGFSAYTINRDNLKPLLIIMLSILWYNTRKNTNAVILTLNQRYTMMRLNNLNRTLEATLAKIKMMKIFRLFTDCLFTTEILNLIFEAFFFYFASANDTDEKNILLADAVEVLEMISVFGICVAFSAKYRGAFFDMADFDSENEVREITPMYEAVQEVPNQDSAQDKPFVIRSPVENEADNRSAYSDLMIAIPMTQRFLRPVVDELHEPLLPNRLDREDNN